MPELGPLVVVLGHLDRVEADRLAGLEAAAVGGTWRYIGCGWSFPDGYAPDGLWIHAYATQRPSPLESVLTLVAEGQMPVEGDVTASG
jgi:hypothetical protein